MADVGRLHRLGVALPEPGRPLQIGEQEGDRAARQAPHRPLLAPGVATDLAAARTEGLQIGPRTRIEDSSARRCNDELA